jgi:ABC-2 type transport system ATP-binding protein
MPVPSSPSNTVARLTGVTKAYAGRPVVKSFDFALQAGAVTALLGPNGAGKSTVAGLMTGRLAADAGEIALFDLDPRDAEARARMGVMLQAAGLPESHSVAEAINLQAGYFKRRLKIKDILEQAGLTTLAKRRCDKLSGGEQRRVQFALAIAGNPDFLVLDEPTTGFDAEAAPRHVAHSCARRLMPASPCCSPRITWTKPKRSRIASSSSPTASIIADGPPAAIKAKVAGSTIRIRTALAQRICKMLPGAAKVDQRGADTAILSTNARVTLEALFSADPALTEFEVASASLEDALADIIANTVKEAA